jgi:hypothetical protein
MSSPSRSPEKPKNIRVSPKHLAYVIALLTNADHVSPLLPINLATGSLILSEKDQERERDECLSRAISILRAFECKTWKDAAEFSDMWFCRNIPKVVAWAIEEMNRHQTRRREQILDSGGSRSSASKAERDVLSLGLMSLDHYIRHHSPSLAVFVHHKNHDTFFRSIVLALDCFVRVGRGREFLCFDGFRNCFWKPEEGHGISHSSLKGANLLDTDSCSKSGFTLSLNLNKYMKDLPKERTAVVNGYYQAYGTNHALSTKQAIDFSTVLLNGGSYTMVENVLSDLLRTGLVQGRSLFEMAFGADRSKWPNNASELSTEATEVMKISVTDRWNNGLCDLCLRLRLHCKELHPEFSEEHLETLYPSTGRFVRVETTDNTVVLDRVHKLADYVLSVYNTKTGEWEFGDETMKNVRLWWDLPTKFRMSARWTKGEYQDAMIKVIVWWSSERSKKEMTKDMADRDCWFEKLLLHCGDDGIRRIHKNLRRMFDVFVPALEAPNGVFAEKLKVV